MTPAVFLDRDNTIIDNDADLGDADLVKLVQGAASAIASLRGLGYRIIVVSNQGGVARGKYTEADVDKVHERINDLIRATSGATVDRFYFCPYHPEGVIEQYRREHPWRKPAPGMILQAAEDLDIDIGQSWMVGDQMRDVESGLRAGVRTILLRVDAEELSPLKLEEIASAHFEEVEGGQGQRGPHFTARNLIEAVRIIAQQRKPEAPDEMRQREKTAKKWDAGAARAARGVRQPAETPPAQTVTAEPEAAPRLAAQTPATTIKERPARRFRVPGESSPSPAPAESASPAPAPALVTPKTVSPPIRPAPLFTPPATPAPELQTKHEAEIADALRQDELAGAEAMTSKPERVVEVEKPSPVPATDSDSMQLILQELRHQRGASDDFPMTRLLAIVLQIIVVVCLLGGLWLGRDSIDAFHRWIGAGILIQLATIAILLLGR